MVMRMTPLIATPGGFAFIGTAIALLDYNMLQPFLSFVI